MKVEVDIRDAFFDQIYNHAAKDSSLIFISADADAFSLQRFKRDFPDRFINVGVAEQNMVTVATGLALSGKNVFIYAILPFVTMRCYEQIKFNICGMNLPVTIVGVGTGFSFDFDGPSHHGVGDIGVMRMLPEMTIYNPATPLCAENCANAAYHSSTPVCVRLDKGKMKEFYTVETDFSKGFNVLVAGSDLCLLATGREVHRAVGIASNLKGRGIDTGVIDVHRLKPVDVNALLNTIGSYRWAATIEENSIVGGLGSIVAEIFIDNSFAIPLKRLALPDVQCLKYGNRDWLHAYYRFDTPSIVADLVEWVDARKTTTKGS
jgi:transketolase